MGASNDSVVVENGNFQRFGAYFFGYKASVIIRRCVVYRRLFSDLKMHHE